LSGQRGRFTVSRRQSKLSTIMGGSASATPTYAQPMGAEYAQGMGSALALNNGVANAAIAMPSELRQAEVDRLQTMAPREALINALKSAELERTVTPDVAKTRAGLSAQMSQDLEGGPSTALSNLWLKQGLTDALATGARSDSGFARSALADNTRASYIQDRQNLQDRAGRFLTANPMPVAGLDPGAIATTMTGVNSANANARDAYKTQVLNILGNNAANVSNAFQQAMQMEAARRANDAQSMNAMTSANMQAASSRQAAILGAIGSGLGSAASIASTGIAYGGSRNPSSGMFRNGSWTE
jgi:hypothetical protein